MGNPPDSESAIPTAVAATESVGDKIGRYRLLQPLGEGGCGVVYLAEQEEPIRRQVAFKVIKMGMDTKLVVARFEAERQALALMDHPNIAKVLDAGSTQAGRPFFVMELVRGIRITDYCDQHNLRTGERLDLFVQVCHAIQHAHQKGIIHRDIKPSNILVTVQDGVPTPKVIDFGIAKATMGQRLTNNTLVTASGEFLGTPAYMSPEQIDLNVLDIDTRADIYSLGVLLYEMLTGKTPFEHWDLVSRGLEEMRRTVRDREPVRPSTRLRTMMAEELSTVARRRQADPPRLIQTVCGDLDWIVLKALDKDRTRRYSSASEFAEDVRRHLGHEPVVAGPPGAAYRVRKFVRRHRVGTALSATMALALVVAAIATTTGLVRAQKAEAAARAEARKAKAINQFLQDVLGSADPVDGIRRDATVFEALKKATGEINRAFGQQPDVAAELKVTIANTYLRLGHHEPAESLLRSSLGYFEGKPGPTSSNLVAVLNSLAIVRQERGDYAESEALYRRALELKRKGSGERDPETLSIMSSLSVLLTDKRDFAEAETLCRSIVKIRRQLPAHDPVDLGIDLNNLGRVLQDKGETAAAMPVFQEAVTLFRRANHPYLGVALGNQAVAATTQGHLREAMPLFEEAQQSLLKHLGESSQDLALVRAKYGRCLLRDGQATRARQMLLEALPVLRGSLGDQNERTRQAIADLSEACGTLGDTAGKDQYRQLLDANTNSPSTR